MPLDTCLKAGFRKRFQQLYVLKPALNCTADSFRNKTARIPKLSKNSNPPLAVLGPYKRGSFILYHKLSFLALISVLSLLIMVLNYIQHFTPKHTQSSGKNICVVHDLVGW